MKIFSFLKIATVSVLSIALLSACMGGNDTPPAVDKDPVEVLQESITNLDGVKSGNYSFVLNGDVTSEEMLEVAGDTNLIFNFALSGAFDVSDEENPVLSFNVDLGVKAGDDSETLKFETRLLSDTLYFSLLELTDLDGMVPAEMVKPFMGNWWNIALPEGTSAEIFASQDQEDYLPSELDDFKEIFMEHKIFGDVEYVRSEKVAGTNTYKYAFSLDNDAFFNYIMLSNEMAEANVSDEEIEELSAALENLTFEGFMWIGKEDDTLRKLSGKLILEEFDGVAFEIDLILELSNLNEKISLTAPSDSLEFDPEIFMGSMF
jgi:hypothetical protein